MIESGLLALGAFAVFALFYKIYFIPVHIWDFTHKGHAIKIKNYSFNEVIYVNGQQLKKTKVQSGMNPIHRFTLPDGEEISVHFTVSSGVRCQIFAEKTLIFDSADLSFGIKAQPQDFVAQQESPRRQAALTLLQDLSSHERADVVTAGKQLWAAIDVAYGQLEKANHSIAAYKAIDEASQPELESLIERLERKIQTLLTALTKLHQNACIENASEIVMPTQVADIMMQLQAEQEVADDHPRPKRRDRNPTREL